MVYLTPIHPIGRTNRKGRNNALVAEPGDPGSFYAIGSPEGGHDAIHPELGTLDDFRRFVAACAQPRDGGRARLRGAMLARSSVDRRSIRNGSSAGPTARSTTPKIRRRNTRTSSTRISTASIGERLWLALRDVVLFWVEQGVRIFRVDNPHTKPLPFWEWLIREVQDRDPEVDLPGRSLYPPESHEGAGQARLHPILHLLHLAHRPRTSCRPI